MEWFLRQSYPPTQEPVTLEEARKQCEIAEDVGDDDAILTRLIKMARQYVEDLTNRSLMLQGWEQSFTGWPNGNGNNLELRRGPFAGGALLAWKDTDGLEATVASADYIFDDASDPARIYPAYGFAWPSGSLYPANPVRVAYAAGYSEVGTGTVTTAGTAVTGSGTDFATDLAINNAIAVGGQVRKVTAIASATALTVDRAFSPNLSAAAFRIGKPEHVPEKLRHAMLLLISTYFDHRNEIVVGQTATVITQLSSGLRVRDLCADYRLHYFG